MFNQLFNPETDDIYQLQDEDIQNKDYCIVTQSGLFRLDAKNNVMKPKIATPIKIITFTCNPYNNGKDIHYENYRVIFEYQIPRTWETFRVYYPLNFFIDKNNSSWLIDFYCRGIIIEPDKADRFKRYVFDTFTKYTENYQEVVKNPAPVKMDFNELMMRK